MDLYDRNPNPDSSPIPNPNPNPNPYDNPISIHNPNPCANHIPIPKPKAQSWASLDGSLRPTRANNIMVRIKILRTIIDIATTRATAPSSVLMCNTPVVLYCLKVSHSCRRDWRLLAMYVLLCWGVSLFLVFFYFFFLPRSRVVATIDKFTLRNHFSTCRALIFGHLRCCMLIQQGLRLWMSQQRPVCTESWV